MQIDASLRKHFPTLDRKTYLNSGSYGLLANQVRAAFEEYLTSREEKGSDWPEWTRKCTELRAKLATLLHADEARDSRYRPPRQPASTRWRAPWSSPANATRWSSATSNSPPAPRSGTRRSAVAPASSTFRQDAHGYLPIEHFDKAIDQNTKLVAITHVCYRNGAKLDVAAITELAHSRGALVLLDCYQSVGVTEVDVRRLNIDFAVGGMLKYLLGTAGIGFLYCRKDLIDALAPTQSGWFAQAPAHMMDIDHNIPAPDAQRFQAGTPPVPSGYAASAGLDIILSLGVEAIEAHVRQLTGLCMDRLIDAGVQLATPRNESQRGPTVAIRSTSCEALVARLAESNIVTSSRDGNVRAMFHCYNDEADIDTLVDALLANRALLKTG